MSDMEFDSAPLPGGDEAPFTAGQGQPGVTAGPSTGQGDGYDQTATLPDEQGMTGGESIAPPDWNSDPKFREWQSKRDRELAEARREARLAREAMERLQEQAERQRSEQETRERQNEEMRLRSAFEQRMRSATTEQQRQQVKLEYERALFQNQQQAWQRDQQTREVLSTRDAWVGRARQAGIPDVDIARALADAGSDPQRQIAQITQLSLDWAAHLNQMRQQTRGQAAPTPTPQQGPPQGYPQGYPTSPQGYGAAPQGYPPAQPPAAAQPQAMRQPATTVARPGAVTPAPLSLAELRNEAKLTGDWSKYNQAKAQTIRSAKQAERDGRFS